MRRFLITLTGFLLIPIIGLAVLYFIADPYKTLKPFSLEDFDSTNRDYLSSELFLMNYPEKKYDSFIFGSSRGCGINTYHWAKYLPEGSSQFLFQSWSETLTGIEQKISYIFDHGYPIKNAIVLIDIPGTFSKDQLPKRALAIKDPNISGQSHWIYQSILMYDFMQKPSQWLKAVRQMIHPSLPTINFDPVSNDWNKHNSSIDLSIPPPKDSLSNLSKRAKVDFLNELKVKEGRINVSDPLIDENMKMQLKHIREIFDTCGTDFKIVITPGYCYSYPAVSRQDLELLKSCFGEERVFNYTGKNPLTSDYNNYSDPNHFGLFVGWHIIEDIYNTIN